MVSFSPPVFSCDSLRCPPSLASEPLLERWRKCRADDKEKKCRADPPGTRRCVTFVETSLVSSTHASPTAHRSPPLCPVRTAKSSLSVKGTPPRALHATISRPSRSFASRSRTSVFSRHPSSQCIPAVTKTQSAQNIALGQRTRNQAMVRGPGPVASSRADDLDVVTLSQCPRPSDPHLDFTEHQRRSNTSQKHRNFFILNPDSTF